jgi:hypothetical protein
MEGDELLRAAWKVTLAEEIDARRLLFVDERWVPTPHWLLFGPGRSKGKERTARCLVTGVRTPRSFRA